MPLYEYECTACHRRTEKIQKFSDAELTVCPYCGGSLERTLTAPNVQFKGGGWYKDLYSSVKPAAGGGDSSGEANSSGSGASDPGSKGATSTASGDSGRSGETAKPAATPGASASTPAAPAPASATATKA